MNKLTITCPYCDKNFSADDALKNHLKNLSLQEKQLMLWMNKTKKT